jgi:hypothetical protein
VFLLVLVILRMVILALNSISRLVFIMQTYCVPCKVGTGFMCYEYSDERQASDGVALDSIMMSTQNSVLLVFSSSEMDF